MFVTIWEFIVRANTIREFEFHYNANGTWVTFFQKGNGYLGTELLKDNTMNRKYVTMDKWISEAAYQKFREEHINEYQSLDAQCASLTESETHIGTYTTVTTNP
ncbi:MAG: hypothetical protein KGZ58_13515 [Ignavibacteriales bacterium]|nr:hypothetical protein [Ignavibacteriales bacterium]